MRKYLDFRRWSKKTLRRKPRSHACPRRPGRPTAVIPSLMTPIPNPYLAEVSRLLASPPFARRAAGSRHPGRHATRHRLGHRGRGRNPNYATSQGVAMDEIGVLRHAFWVASLSRTVSPQAESVHTCADHPLRPHFASQSSSLVHRPPLESREVPISSTHHGSSSHQRPAHAARRAYPLYCL